MIYIIYIYMFDVCGYGVIIGYMAYMSVISIKSTGFVIGEGVQCHRMSGEGGKGI